MCIKNYYYSILPNIIREDSLNNLRTNSFTYLSKHINKEIHIY